MKPYFSHDEGARNDPKLIRVLMRLGQAGKGVYWDLVEMLHEQGGYLPLSDLESMAFGLRTDLALLTSLLNDFGLFSQNTEHFWSETALTRLHLRNAKAEARAAAGAKGGKAKAEKLALLQQTPSIASQDSSNAMALPVETLASKEKESKEKESKQPLPLVEDAASAAAPEPEKKIEPVEASLPNPESPATELRTPGGAADVAPLKVSRGGKKLKPEPGSANPADYQLPEWAGEQFVAEFGSWLSNRQSRADCKPLTAKAVQARLKELATYDEVFCSGLFRAAEQNPHWQGLTFDNTPHKFTQHILALQKLQQDAARQNQPINGAKPNGNTAADMAEFLVRRRFQQPGGTAGHTGQTTGAHPGQSTGGAAGFSPN